MDRQRCCPGPTSYHPFSQWTARPAESSPLPPHPEHHHHRVTQVDSLVQRALNPRRHLLSCPNSRSAVNQNKAAAGPLTGRGFNSAEYYAKELDWKHPPNLPRDVSSAHGSTLFFTKRFLTSPTTPIRYVILPLSLLTTGLVLWGLISRQRIIFIFRPTTFYQNKSGQFDSSTHGGCPAHSPSLTKQ